jgi:NOL1/NOP2/sun family putative RNA methylase
VTPPRGPIPEELFPRYRAIVPAWNRFEEVCSRPQPTTIRVNTLRTTPDDVQKRLAQAGIEARANPSLPLLLDVPEPVGRSLEHWLGDFYIQEASQAVPVDVLDPRPGETVLDLCAAPGGKTTQIAAAMENAGVLIANEPSGRRQQALLANVNRLGVLSATITEYRGESFPLRACFDRVLLDAPCSAEGTLRKEPALRGGASLGTIRRLAKLQKRLILRAFDLLKAGGILVYSTCTFAPEENEEVVAHLVREREASVRSVRLPFAAAPGLTEWGGASLPKELGDCVRIYPHHLDSGGGFLARIERPR